MNILACSQAQSNVPTKIMPDAHHMLCLYSAADCPGAPGWLRQHASYWTAPQECVLQDYALMPTMASGCKARHCMHQRGSEGLQCAWHLVHLDCGQSWHRWRSVAMLHKQHDAGLHMHVVWCKLYAG